MKVYAPAYYKNFECIADKCENNCCIGWEIDIDEDSLLLYSKHSDIMRNIQNDDNPHFILKEKERCPYLNDKNLCDLIIKYGKGYLCQICRDHPRFFNYFDSRCEIGIGLTCPSAAKLIIDNEFSIIECGENNDIEFLNPEEEKFFVQRDIYLNSDIEDLKALLPHIKLSNLYDIFINLERLDTSWDDYLLPLKNQNINIKDVKIFDKRKAHNLFCYFVYRHLHNTSIAFCLLCTYFLMALGGDIYNTARMFSSEIEYSDENVEKLNKSIKIC